MIDFFSRPWLVKLIGINYQFISDCPLRTDFDFIHDLFKKEFGYYEIECGGFRRVYEVDSDWVVKFPICQGGVQCNVVEQTLYNMYKNTGRFAKCRIQNYNGAPLLFMERVSDYFGEEDEKGNQKHFFEDLPDWAHHQDGPQVGFTKNRKLVIYDYGNCLDMFDKWYYKNMKKTAKALTNASN